MWWLLNVEGARASAGVRPLREEKAMKHVREITQLRPMKARYSNGGGSAVGQVLGLILFVLELIGKFAGAPQ